MVSIDVISDAEWKTARERADILRPLAELGSGPINFRDSQMV